MNKVYENNLEELNSMWKDAVKNELENSEDKLYWLMKMDEKLIDLLLNIQIFKVEFLGAVNMLNIFTTCKTELNHCGTLYEFKIDETIPNKYNTFEPGFFPKVQESFMEKILTSIIFFEYLQNKGHDHSETSLSKQLHLSSN